MAVTAAAKKARWWDGDPTQRYWMELVKRKGWGAELIAPNDGKHQHVWEVAEGERIFHWLGTRFVGVRKSGIYASSIVAAPPESTPNDIEWANSMGPGVRVPLTDFIAIEPLLLKDLSSSEAEIMAVNADLLNKFPSPHFFPFQKGSGAFRPREAYLAKVPKKVVDIVAAGRPESDWGGFDAPLLGVLPVAGQNGVRQRYAGFCADPILKKAIETQAVRQAIAHYEAAKYRVEDVGAFAPYDLKAVSGDEIRHVEVKGSQSYVQKVILTRNEVDHANEFDRTDLVVVADIGWERRLDGSIATGDGTMSVYRDWRPSPENLKPLSFEYFLD